MSLENYDYFLILIIVFFNWTCIPLPVRFDVGTQFDQCPVNRFRKGCKVRNGKKNDARNQARVTLKALAEYVGLSTGTISIVLNDTPRASVIPQQTKDRIFQAARELNYQPNPFARALRANRTVTERGSVQDSGASSGTLMFVGAEHYSRAIQAIRGAGLRVPGDVSIVGIDDSHAAFVLSAREL